MAKLVILLLFVFIFNTLAYPVDESVSVNNFGELQPQLVSVHDAPSELVRVVRTAIADPGPSPVADPKRYYNQGHNHHYPKYHQQHNHYPKHQCYHCGYRG